MAQKDLGFAVPFLDEDIPLYIDPFLLWKSPSFSDKSLHQMLMAAFNNLGAQFRDGNRQEAIEQLVLASECDEVGLGVSSTRKGKRIGPKKAEEILGLFEQIQYYRTNGFRHLEEIQLFVDGIGKDRISDISASFLKSYLIDYTQDQAVKLGLPMQSVEVSAIYDPNSKKFKRTQVECVVHPETAEPILFVPKHWLRFVPWIGFDVYFRDFCPQDDISHTGEELSRVDVLTHNRDNFGLIDSFVTERERTSADCESDPLFHQIPVLSAKRRLKKILKLPTGKTDGADQTYEKEIGTLLPTLLYPDLDFAKVQSRSIDGVSIKDLVFYNNRSDPFLSDLMEDYGSQQLTFEMKNVKSINREHIDQVNRYLTDSLGKFGVIVTRNPLAKAEVARTVNLWSGQRKAVISLTDADIELMVQVYETKQRKPLDILKWKYVEYQRKFP